MVLILLTAVSASVASHLAQRGYLGRSAASAHASSALFRSAHAHRGRAEAAAGGGGGGGGAPRAVLLPWGGEEADALVAAANRGPLLFRSVLGQRRADRAERWRLRSDAINRPEIGSTAACVEETQGEGANGAAEKREGWKLKARCC